MESYTLTYYRLRKREPFIALSSHQEGGGGWLNFCIHSTPREIGTDLNTFAWRIDRQILDVYRLQRTSMSYNSITQQNSEYSFCRSNSTHETHRQAPVPNNCDCSVMSRMERFMLHCVCIQIVSGQYADGHLCLTLFLISNSGEKTNDSQRVCSSSQVVIRP